MKRAAVIVIAAQIAGGVQAATDQRIVLPPESAPGAGDVLSHLSGSNGEARWTLAVRRMNFSQCPADAGTYTDENNVSVRFVDTFRMGEICVRYSLIVRNDSKVAIQCRGALEFSRPDIARFKRLEVDRVLLPGGEVVMLRSYVTNHSPPKLHSVDCVALPVGPLAPLDTPAECRPEFSGPSPEGFYPPDARSRKVEGAAVLEFTLTADTTLTDVRVVEGSGHTELDDAALYYSKLLRAKSSCAGTRARTRVRFAIPEPAS